MSSSQGERTLGGRGGEGGGGREQTKANKEERRGENSEILSERTF